MEFKDYGLTLNLHGTHLATVPAGQTANVDYVITSDCLINACDYEAINRNHGDKITFQVIHPVYGVVGQFATKIFAREKMYYEFYKAQLKTGLIVRVIYENVGTNDVNLSLNLVEHKDKV